MKAILDLLRSFHRRCGGYFVHRGCFHRRAGFNGGKNDSGREPCTRFPHGKKLKGIKEFMVCSTNQKQPPKIFQPEPFEKRTKPPASFNSLCGRCDDSRARPKNG